MPVAFWCDALRASSTSEALAVKRERVFLASIHRLISKAASPAHARDLAPPGGLADPAGLPGERLGGTNRECLYPPLFATVWFGANDAVLAETGSAQHVPLPQFTSTLTQIVREVQAHARFVLLLTPPPVDEEARMQWQRNTLGQSTGPERTDASAARYADACRQVAAACNVTMVDVRGAFLSTPDYKALLSDGLHLSPAGSDVVFATVMRTVRDHLPTECWPENMPLDFPDWKDLA